jgi:phospholipid/cholesterol/gamma-HCH transport system substrate-binding protein
MKLGATTEIIVGAIVFAIVAIASVSIFDGSSSASSDVYRIEAKFTRVDGVNVGTDVMAAGIPVGSVVDMRLDENFFAVLTIELDRSVELDSDASAQIVSESIFGSKYIRVDIGGGESIIQDGGRIFYVESAMIVEDLLKQIVPRGQARAGR